MAGSSCAPLELEAIRNLRIREQLLYGNQMQENSKGTSKKTGNGATPGGAPLDPLYQNWWPMQEQKLLNERRQPLVPVLLTWEENTLHLLDWPRVQLAFDDVLVAVAKQTAHSHMGRWGQEDATPSTYTEIRHRVFIVRPNPTSAAAPLPVAASASASGVSGVAMATAASSHLGGNHTHQHNHKHHGHYVGDEHSARFMTRELRQEEPVEPPPAPFFLVVGPEALSLSIRGTGEFPVQLHVAAHLTVFELKVLYAEAGGGTAQWMDLALEGEFLRNERRLFEVPGIRSGALLRAVVQPGGPLMLRVRAFWGKSYRVQVYRTTDVAELARSVIFHCVSDSCPDDFVDQQFMHSKEFAVKVGQTWLTENQMIYHHVQASGECELLVNSKFGTGSSSSTMVTHSDGQFLVRVRGLGAAGMDGRDCLELAARPVIESWASIAMRVHGATDAPLDRFELRDPSGAQVLDWRDSLLFPTNGTTIEAVMHRRARSILARDFLPARAVRVRVRTLSGIVYPVEMSLDFSVANIKRRLANLGVKEVHHTKLYYKEQLLSDNAVLDDAGVQWDEQLALVLVAFPMVLHLHGQRKLPLVVHNDRRISALKYGEVLAFMERFADYRGTEKEVSLVFAGEELRDETSACECGLYPDGELFAQYAWHHVPLPSLALLYRDARHELRPIKDQTARDAAARVFLDEQAPSTLTALRSLVVWWKHQDHYFDK